jgi:acid phosphatase family membrane protein YuiD
MSFLISIHQTGWEVLLAATLSSLLAQLLKTLVHLIQKRDLDLSILFSTGGMPSSHSATVSAVATSVGLISGFSSTLFALALIFAFVVMYDAAGVRRAASIQARILNEILRELFSEQHHLNREKLKELLGHTPFQVFIGALLGIGISLLLHYLTKT